MCTTVSDHANAALHDFFYGEREREFIDIKSPLNEKAPKETS